MFFGGIIGSDFRREAGDFNARLVNIHPELSLSIEASLAPVKTPLNPRALAIYSKLSWDKVAKNFDRVGKNGEFWETL